VKRESIHDVLPEAQELSCDIGLRCSGGSALGEACSNGSIDDFRTLTLQLVVEYLLFNPNHVRQIHPAVRIRHGLVGPILPDHWTILLKEALKRATTRTAVQPNGNFILRSRVLRWEEPKVEFRSIGGI
jgi:hypothetical protein